MLQRLPGLRKALLFLQTKRAALVRRVRFFYRFPPT
jgi:hypothetical protein